MTDSDTIMNENQHDIFKQAMTEVSSALISSHDLDFILELISTQICNVLHTHWIFFILLDFANKKISKLIVSKQFAKSLQYDGYSYEEAMSGLTGWVVQNRKAALSIGQITDERETEEVRKRRELNDCGSIIVAPLLFENEVYGTVTAINTKSQSDFNENDVSLFTILANQASAGIYNKMISDRLMEEQEKLKRLNSEKELLLKEVYHRIKNNLQLIGSILHNQKKSTKDEYVQSILQTIETRINSIALVHQNLYLSQDLSTIDTKDYIQNLLVQLTDAYSELIEAKSIQIIDSISSCRICMKYAVTFGLLLNELIINALKYAFQEKTSENKIHISIIKNNGLIELIISDNGIGMPDLTGDMVSSLGIMVITGTVQQLNGTYEMSNKKGTTWTIRIPQKSLQPSD